MPRDQRGQPCRAFVPPLRLVLRWETRRAREGAAAMGGMPRAVFREGLWGTTFTRRSCLFFGAVTLVCLAALVVLLAVAARLLAPPSPGWFMVQFAAPLATFALVPLGIRGQIRLNWWRWVWLIAARGHCPSCGYALVNLPEEDDGCRVCAECGVAGEGWGGRGGVTGPHRRVAAEESKLAAVRRLPRVVRRAIALQIAIALGLVLPMMLAVFMIPDFGGWIVSGHVGVLAALAVLSTLPLFAIVWGGIRMNRLRSRISAARGALCPECCYPLVSIDSDTCPECGWPGGVEAARRAWKDAGMWMG